MIIIIDDGIIYFLEVPILFPGSPLKEVSRYSEVGNICSCDRSQVK
ncbi:hypothetical protein [Nostoc sp.]